MQSSMVACPTCGKMTGSLDRKSNIVICYSTNCSRFSRNYMLDLYKGKKIGIYCTSGKNAIPKKAYASDAGFDLTSLESKVLDPGERHSFHTGIHIVIPNNRVLGLIKPRSGLAMNAGIDVLAGVIDSGYTGEVCVILINHGNEPAHIWAHSRIAQLIFIGLADIKGLDILDENRYNILRDEKDRKDRGYGSTGAY